MSDHFADLDTSERTANKSAAVCRQSSFLAFAFRWPMAGLPLSAHPRGGSRGRFSKPGRIRDGPTNNTRVIFDPAVLPG
jgi:hypothetical protein